MLTWVRLFDIALTTLTMFLVSELITTVALFDILITFAVHRQIQHSNVTTQSTSVNLHSFMLSQIITRSDPGNDFRKILILTQDFPKFVLKECGFFYSGPAAWNTLPSKLHDNTDTSTFINDSRVYFLIVLTTDYCWQSWTCRIAAIYKSRIDWLTDSISQN